MSATEIDGCKNSAVHSKHGTALMHHDKKTVILDAFDTKESGKTQEVINDVINQSQKQRIYMA